MSEIKILHHTDGDYVPKELLDSAQGKLKIAKEAIERRMRSDDACGFPFDEDLGEALKELEGL